MNPRKFIDDEDGTWLSFLVDERPVLTVYSPYETYQGTPLSLGWAGTTEYANVVSVLAGMLGDQLDWHNKQLAGYAEKWNPNVLALTYGAAKETASFPINQPYIPSNLTDSLGDLLEQRKDDLQLLRLEIRSAYGDDKTEVGKKVKKNPDFAFWARFSLSAEKARSIPNGTIGVSLRLGDLRRVTTEDIIAEFIAKTHVDGVAVRDAREMLRNAVTILNPTSQGKAA